MAANTKYQAAPQRDSFEEANYSQAPPSYQAESRTDEDLLGGAPRGEDDNVPDEVLRHFVEGCSHVLILTSVQFGGSVSEATLPIRMQFIRKVYSIL
jgi:hypothetical protein